MTVFIGKQEKKEEKMGRWGESVYVGVRVETWGRGMAGRGGGGANGSKYDSSRWLTVASCVSYIYYLSVDLLKPEYIAIINISRYFTPDIYFFSK